MKTDDMRDRDQCGRRQRGQRQRGRGRDGLWLLLMLIAVVGVGLMPGQALGQGTMGMLPNPITTGELSEYADRLDLSAQQRIALEEKHDAYRRRFAALRETEIADLMQRMNSMSGTMPGREDFEAYLTGLERAAASIERVDRSLFTDMQSILTDDQLAILPRVEMARSRARNSGVQMTFLVGGPPLDLSEVVLDLDLSPTERMTIDPLLSGYETKLTSELESLSKMVADIFRNFYTAAEEAGFEEGEVDQDPAKAMEMAQKMMEIQREIMRGAMERGNDIRALNARTYRSIRSALGPGEAEQSLRDQYAMRVAPTSKWSLKGATSWPAGIEQLDSLTSEQQEQIDAIVQRYRQSLGTLSDDLIKTAETAPAVDPFMMSFGGNSEQDAEQARAREAQEHIQQLTARIEALSQGAREEINSTLNAQQTARLDMFAAALSSGQELPVDGMPVEQAGDAVAVGDDAMLQMAHQDLAQQYGFEQIDPRVGFPVTADELTRYAQLLRLDESGRAVLDELYNRYQESYETFSRTQLAAVQAQQQEAWTAHAETGEVQHNAVYDPRQTAALRTQARQALVAVDNTFIDEIEMTLASAGEQTGTHAEGEIINRPMMRVRLLRERERLGNQWGGMAAGMNMFGGGGTFVDLTTLVREVGLDPDADAAVDDKLFQYEVALADELQAYAQASRDVQTAMERFSILQMQAQGDMAAAQELYTDFSQELAGPQQASMESMKALLNLNRETVDELEALSAPERAGELRRTYRHRAYPTVYTDSMNAEAKLTAALSLNDLTDAQRTQLLDLATDYRPAREALCDRMVTLADNATTTMPTPSTEPQDISEWQRQFEEMQKLTFERDEQAARVISRLRGILNDQQIKRLRLPELKRDRDGMWWD